MEDEEFELFITDLGPKVRKDLLNFLGLKTVEEGNLDTFPVAIIPKPEE